MVSILADSASYILLRNRIYMQGWNPAFLLYDIITFFRRFLLGERLSIESLLNAIFSFDSLFLSFVGETPIDAVSDQTRRKLVIVRRVPIGRGHYALKSPKLAL